jgi:hypothetical protein
VLANIGKIDRRERLAEQGIIIDEPKYAEVQHFNVNNYKNVRHDNTRASKQTRLIENELAIKLTRITNNIKDDRIVEQIQARLGYNNLISDTIRSSVERVYKIGVDYVNEFINLEGFLTDFDLNKIKELSTTLSEEFWVSLEKNIFARKRLMKTDIDVKNLMEIIASRIATLTLNMATINKARQISMRTDSLNVAPKVSSILKGRLERPKMYFFNRNKMMQFLFAATNDFSFFSRLPSIANTTLLVQVWTTELDDQVCTRFECAQLHGEYWEVGDPNTLVPPVHPRCRCRLLLAENSFPDSG